jgi:hypothetical protein
MSDMNPAANRDWTLKLPAPRKIGGLRILADAMKGTGFRIGFVSPHHSCWPRPFIPK